jgi:hypothetical protein
MTRVNIRTCPACYWNTHLEQEGTATGIGSSTYDAVCPLSGITVQTTERCG